MSDAGLTRFQFDGVVDHQGGQQFVGGKGFAGDVFARAHRPEPHGFASHPVKGGIGLVAQSRSQRDAAYILGGENPSLRPEGEMLTAGGTAIYDATGNIVSVVAAKLRIVHSAAIHMIAPEIIFEGNCRLGGPSAARQISAQGTVDTGGNTDDSNFAGKVFGL